MSISSLVSVLMSTRIWIHIHLFYMSTAVLCQHDLIPVVPHKAVAEVSK